jgi:hypothetical protein
MNMFGSRVYVTVFDTRQKLQNIYNQQILNVFSGGVRPTMYGKLPSEILSNLGFQGCLASIELNGEAADPIHNAQIPSEFVNNGCEGSLVFGVLAFLQTK